MHITILFINELKLKWFFIILTKLIIVLSKTFNRNMSW